MMRMLPLFLFLSPAIFAQSDSQILQGVLQELRQLRQDLQGMALTGQRVQILLHRLQIQDEATKKAIQRHEQLTAKVMDAESRRLEAASSLKAMEEKLAAVQDNAERVRLEELLRELKRRLDMWTHDESAFRASEAAAGGDLRNEQAKLTELQQRLDKLERQLETYSAR